MSSVAIFLHGPLHLNSHDEDIVRLRSWRQCNKNSKLIFGVSQVSGYREGRVVNFPPDDARVVALLTKFSDLADAVVLAPFAKSLPPLKFDDKINNCNKMISVVNAGLDAVKADYVLRIRSDAYIHYFSQLQDEYEKYATKNFHSSEFSARLCICPYFTLNPFLLERLPFHISDWFNYGRLDDVKRFWDVKPFSFHDAIYFEYEDHSDLANLREKNFRSRLSPEQHITTTFAKRLGYAIPKVAYEQGFGRQTLDLLRSHFIVSDDRKIGFTLPKYGHVKTSKEVDLLCVRHKDWVSLYESGLDAFLKENARKVKLIVEENLKAELKQTRRKNPLKYRLMRISNDIKKVCSSSKLGRKLINRFSSRECVPG